MRDGRRRQRVNGTAAPRAPPPQPQRPRDAAESEGTLNSPAASTHQRCTRDSERPNARRLSAARGSVGLLLSAILVACGPAQSVVSEPDASPADAASADAERADGTLGDNPVVDGANPDVPDVDAAVDVVSVDVVVADSASDVPSATDVVAVDEMTPDAPSGADVVDGGPVDTGAGPPDVSEIDAGIVDVPAMDTGAVGVDTAAPMDATVGPDVGAVGMDVAAAMDTPAITDAGIADVPVDGGPALGGIGAPCVSNATCSSGACAVQPRHCDYVTDPTGWVRSNRGYCPTSPTTVPINPPPFAAVQVSRQLRSDGYCWVRFSWGGTEETNPLLSTSAYLSTNVYRLPFSNPFTTPTACTASSDCVQFATSYMTSARVDAAIGTCSTLTGYCTLPCRSIDDCPVGSNWTCQAPAAGGSNLCACTPTSTVEIQCNGIDDNCDGVTDDTSIMCGTRCVNRAADTANCGGCGVTCRTSEICSAGPCQCPGTSGTWCTRLGACRDLANDSANCGGCGVTCTGTFANATAGCTAGTCGMRCNALYGDCDGSTANGCERSVVNDVMNCGACGHQCPMGASCASGVCACPGGQVACGNRCVALQSDAVNCGACGVACGGSYANAMPTCTAGACRIACNAGYSDCDGLAANGCETRTLDSTANCGGCGRACQLPNATAPSCLHGNCQATACNQSFLACAVPWPDDGCDTPFSASDCGACRRGCAGQLCSSSGVCAAACATGETNCANNCVNLATSAQNCGRCGNVCPWPSAVPGGVPNAVPGCRSGVCGYDVCLTGFMDCDGNTANGCETNSQTSLTNCGRCGRSCSAPNTTFSTTFSCTAGACTITSCAGGFADCDLSASNGCEIDLTLSAVNCGRCGNMCPTGTTCMSGVCR